MKKNNSSIYSGILWLLFFLPVSFFISCGNEQTPPSIPSKTETVNGITNSTFKVWGNCEMCKETIENSLKVDGIHSANWNPETKMMDVSYDASKISLVKIQEHIAASGYDNEKFKGDNKAYGQLPECCQYERKP